MKTKILAFLLALGVLVLCAVFFVALILYPFVQLVVGIIGLICILCFVLYGAYHCFLDILDERFR